MGKLTYNISVGTGDNTLSKNRVSRAFALLTTRIKEGLSYGFQYRFFNQFDSKVDESTLLGERPITQPGDIPFLIMQADDGSIEIGYMMAGKTAEEIRKSTAKILDTVTAITPEINEVHLFPLQQIAANPDSIAQELATFIAGNNTINLGITHTMVTADNCDSISTVMDKVYTMINKNTIGIRDLKMHIFDTDVAWESEELFSLMYESGIDNVSEHLRPHIYMDRVTIESDKMRALEIADNRENDSLFVANSLIEAGWNDDEVEKFRIIAFANKDHINTEFFAKLIEARAKMGGLSKEAVIEQLTAYASRFEKPSRKITFSKTGVRGYKNGRKNQIISILRVGKPISMKVQGIKSYSRGGKSGVIPLGVHIFSDRKPKSTQWFKDLRLMNKFDRNGTNIKRYTLSSRSGRNAFNNETAVKFMNRVRRETGLLESGKADNIKRNALITDVVERMDRILHNAAHEYQVQRAVNPDRPIFRLYNIFEAKVLSKVIFSDREKHQLILVTQQQDGVRNAREAVIIVDLGLDVFRNDRMVELQEKVDLAITKGAESVILFGLVSDNKEKPECDILVTKVSDGKNAVDTVKDLQAIGWGKLEFLMDPSLVVIEGENRRLTESVIATLSLAIDENKKRQARHEEIMEIGDRDDKRLGRIFSPFLHVADAKELLLGKEMEQFHLADWDTEWEQLCRVVVDDTRDRQDKLKVPNDDFDYTNFAKDLYNPTTGVVSKPIGPVNKPDVEVKFPNVHYAAKYNNLYREEIQVDLYAYKDMMLLIWIFWCKHRSDERVRDVLQRFYQDENLDMKIIQEYSRIVQFDAAKAINYVLDNIYTWIQDTMAYYDAARMEMYERIMKQVRWYGEKIAFEMSKFILNRKYDTVRWGMPIDYVHTQPVDGEIIVEAFVDAHSSFAVYIGNKKVIDCSDSGIYKIDNPTLSNFINPAPRSEILAGTHEVKVTMTGNVIFYSFNLTNAKFKSAEVTYTSQPGCGTLAIDKLLTMMYDYYEIHHTGKTKGVRDKWMLS